MPPRPRAREFAAVLILILAALAAYAGSFSGAFVLDDPPSILGNPSIRHLWPLSVPLSPPHGGGLTVEGRPILNLSLALNYALSGTAPWSYHAVNLAIHLLAGLTLFGIVRRTVRRSADAVAFAVALLWLLHPLQTESVTYIVQRAESLMGLFYFFTLYGFIRWVRSRARQGVESDAEPTASRPRLRGGSIWATLSLISCLLGMATKEVMASAPLIVFLYDHTFIAGSFAAAWRQRRGYYLGLAATWILLAGLALHTGSRGGTAGVGVDVKPQAYWLTQFSAIAHYLRLAFWPHPLIFDYGTHWIVSPAQIIPQIALVAALLTATVVALCRWPAAGFLGVCFFALLAPTSLVPGGRQTLAEHRMYLPLAAVITLVVVAVDLRATDRWTRASAARRSAATWIAAALCATCALALGCLTRQRNQTYHSALSLYADTATKAPWNGYAENNLGVELYARGRLPEALEHYQEAVRLDPSYWSAQNNLGKTLSDLGRYAEAVDHYEAAVRLNPKFADAHNGWGNALVALGRRDPAIAQYEEALRLAPDMAEAHNNLANLLLQEGRIAEAIPHYRRAIELNPDYLGAHFNLANALIRLGQDDEAAAHFREALRIQPDFAPARRGLEQLRQRAILSHLGGAR